MNASKFSDRLNFWQLDFQKDLFDGFDSKEFREIRHSVRFVKQNYTRI